MTPKPFARSLPSLPATADLVPGIVLLLVLVACSSPSSQAAPPEPSSDAPPIASEGAPSETWQCSNDVEVRCADGKCEAAAEGEFTPMSVTVSDSGAMSVCAYTGCWEGTGEVVRSGAFVVLIGQDLAFSTSQDAAEDIVIVLDVEDGVATLKAGAFAHPLLCRPEDTPSIG